jgi:DNA-binding LacI/PurR family transcriptional regulator
MAVTMRDVAQRAGVSIKTVSRVVNNQGEISEATRRCVQSVIEELGYRPNVLARGLISGQTLSIGMVIPRITDPFFPEVVLGVENVARQHGYSVFLCNANGDPQQELEYAEILGGKQVDGIILCGSVLLERQLEEVAARQYISVLTSRRPRGAAVISVDEEAGFERVTAHLIGLGHRAIGHICVPPKLNTTWRLNGYCRALEQHAISAHEEWIASASDITIEAGYRACTQLLAQAPEVTAISCFNDLIAVGALRACEVLGRRVPDDVAVTGFDDIELASLVVPALTTVRVPRQQVGEALMRALLQVIETKGRYDAWTHTDLDLVVRASSGP